MMVIIHTINEDKSKHQTEVVLGFSLVYNQCLLAIIYRSQCISYMSFSQFIWSLISTANYCQRSTQTLFGIYKSILPQCLSSTVLTTSGWHRASLLLLSILQVSSPLANTVTKFGSFSPKRLEKSWWFPFFSILDDVDHHTTPKTPLSSQLHRPRDLKPGTTHHVGAADT